jgi:Holliday junction resolvase
VATDIGSKPKIYRKERADGTKVPLKKKKVNSRAKGARGERAFAKLLQDQGLAAYRGQQFRGGTDSPDVVCPDLPHVHFEIKNCKASLEPYVWLEQAIKDAGENKLRIVVHRAKHHNWIAIMPIEDLLQVLLGQKITSST